MATAGWYPDPDDTPGVRWWDGEAWTAAGCPWEPGRSRSRQRAVWVGIGAGLATIVFGVALVTVGYGGLGRAGNQDAYIDCLLARQAGGTDSPTVFRRQVDQIEVPSDLRRGRFALLGSDLLILRHDTDAAPGAAAGSPSSDLTAVMTDCDADRMAS